MASIEPLVQRLSSFSHIKQLQAHLITTGHFAFLPSRSKLIELCAISPFGNLHYATEIFCQIQTPFKNDWNAIIRGFARSNEPKIAITYYQNMFRKAKNPDALTCSFSLQACSRFLGVFEAKQIHSHIVRFGFTADDRLVTTLLDVYAKSNDLNSARKLFDEMPSRDRASWNALIAGLAQGDQPKEALDLFKGMKIEGLKPDEVTVLGVISACSQLGSLLEGETVHSYIKESNLDKNVQVCNALIDMYYKCGSVDKACDVFRSMGCRKSLVSWNSMIMGLGMHGHGTDALNLFNEMSQDGIQPDAITYLSALCACNHAGLVSEGLSIFKSMESSGVKPNVKHYGSVSDLLGRAGRVKEAYEIIKSMPSKPDIVLWQTLLGACKTYGEVELAEIASRALVELGSNSCGDFVLLSNTYAAHERWDDVGKIREAMKSKAVKKIPGISFITIKGSIHKFINGNQDHPDWRDIYKKIDEISLRINSMGYAAETSFVLHDIGEEEKENVLWYHSERLAVAYGLISGGGDGKPIQVNKNLRICVDCHVVIKLISKIYNREIIIRDRARFHHFKDGACSCGDYW
ncbi:pentatricopeptide repeat-containing protein At1g34160-like [Papaver somniferum]|nr:pentatricopeptide repeat-containing protein At1g34160-like [Papaver somniferum]XP_026391479.1 pentatricopeptide repeat-containing protein At1g34160-like [Papaver somniferum]